MSDGQCKEGETELLLWYKSLSPLRVDIVDHFSGKELFAIHGDSLIFHCITDARVDFTNGFQLLHAIYAVESFLANLQRCGCKFHIVWFADQEELCVPNDVSDALASGYRLVRAIVIKHLEHAIGVAETGESPISFQFESMQGDAFQDYLTHNAIHFFLCLDGQDIERNSGANSIQYVKVIQYLSLKGYSVALINNIDFVHASICAPSLSGGPVWVDQMSRTPRIPIKGIAEMEASRGTRLSICSPWEDGEPLSGRDMVCLTAISNTLLVESGNDMRDCIVAYIIHLSLLRRLDLSQRACREAPLSKVQQSCLDKFFALLSNICTSVVETMSFEGRWDVFDLIDGRILRQILGRLQALALPGCIIAEVDKFAALVYQLTLVDVSASIPQCRWRKSASDTAIDAGQHVSPSLLPFSHPALDDFLAPVNMSTAESNDSQVTTKVFEEVSHWHNARVPIDPRHKIRQKGYFAKRRNQLLIASTIAYSASLVNSAGKAIHPETIVSTPECRSSSNEGKDKIRVVVGGSSQRASHKHNSKKAAQCSGRQNALEEAQRIQAEKMKSKASASIMAWGERRREFETEMNLESRCPKVVKYLAGLSSQDMDTVGGEVTLYLCNSIALMILDARKKGTRMPEMGLLAILWSKLVEISTFAFSQEGAALFNLLARAVKMPTAMVPYTPLKGRKLPFASITSSLSDQLRIPVDSLEFQLTHCGPYMERGFDSMPDPRVPFSPDAWQRDVLDAIDANKSLFVVAPTSAGKTFVSFYAMKKVLQSNDDDVIVYVAPTKALVNQIAAEVQARFSKAYSTPGRSVWAIHTRDYRINNPTGCQILITVPHMLQIMLLAPSNAKTANSWSLRVKRIIFDEVHCIGQSDEGVIWEQLLLLAPCPIIALPATVGNPMDFGAWLQGSEKAKGHELEMIVHPHRYSDLRKFIYHPTKDQIFRGLGPTEGLSIPGLDGEQHETSPFTGIHPVASLINRNRSTINDINFEGRDCFVLWQCMMKHQSKEFPLNDALNPRNALPTILKKGDIARWEAALKQALFAWMQDTSSPFSSVRSDLQSPIIQRHLSIQHEASNLSTYEPSNTDVNPNSKKSGLLASALQLLADLHCHGALPAIVFNYDRQYCEKIISFVEKQLTLAESDWKDTKRMEWKKKVAEYEKWKKTSKTHGKRKDRTSLSSQDGLCKKDMVEEAANQDPSVWETFDPEAILDMFSFADRTKLLDSEFDDIIVSLKKANLKPGIIDALRRGMGVHHAGMNRQYRQVVEMLFRKGFLRVVVATGTLALGINMPCRTVVFFGDSVFLTALNYNQAAGRAGRRGFDLLGNVVFVGMTPERVFEIMSSRLPDLHGQFPLSTTLVLRLLGLLHHTANSEYAVKAIRSIQSQTRLYLGGPSNQMTIRHHLRFSIEYLRRQHLLSHTGAPLNFAGLVGHLYFTENAVFAFHSLLKGGYFHELCRTLHQKPQELHLELVLVLAHLFCRIPLRLGSDEPTEDRIHRSPSLVILPPLPKRAETILHEHNNKTLHIFRNYVSSFIDQYLDGQPDNQLPFTKRKVQGTNGRDALSIIDHLPPPKLCSPFAALSGFTDDFQSIHDLCTTVRDGVFLEESGVPYIPIHPNDDARIPWNAYIYDFFKHGDMEALVRDNGIKAGDVWFHLKDFSLILATIITSLTNFFEQGSSNGDAAMMDVQNLSDVLQEDTGDEYASEARDEVDQGAPQHPVALSAKKKKVVLADSWDDDLSSGSSQEENTPSIQSNKRCSVPPVEQASTPNGPNDDEVFKRAWA
ncbi:DEAD/DEAH box helicase [Metarhizium robertsii]|uniref:DEAD/DEAH box helicase n=1 Tax=Metarhizium robertsii TaxID=568076 RepID=A0A014N806_9HYPO|nr:DEAD/DEAH box helicase [Metarhizium robertsii]